MNVRVFRSHQWLENQKKKAFLLSEEHSEWCECDQGRCLTSPRRFLSDVFHFFLNHLFIWYYLFYTDVVLWDAACISPQIKGVIWHCWRTVLATAYLSRRDNHCKVCFGTLQWHNMQLYQFCILFCLCFPLSLFISFSLTFYLHWLCLGNERCSLMKCALLGFLTKSYFIRVRLIKDRGLD